MKKLLALTSLLCVTTAHAVDFDINIGQTKYEKPPNSQWWQDGLDNKFQSQANSIGFGISDYLTESTRWRLGYINLGDISSNALATTDANYNGTNGCIGTCTAMNVYIGKGNIEGVSLTIAPETTIGNTKLFVEGGVWGYIPHFNMVVYETSPGGAGTYKSWDNDIDGHMQFSLLIGAGIEYKKTQFILNIYGTQVSQVSNVTVPMWGTYTTNFSIRKLF